MRTKSFDGLFVRFFNLAKKIWAFLLKIYDFMGVVIESHYKFYLTAR